MMRVVFTALSLLATQAATADVEIHKCVDADGNIAYQQTPCPVAKIEPQEAEQTVEAGEVGEDVVPVDAVATQPVASRADEDIEACKQPLRDAIDDIEAEMLRGFSPEEGEQFKTELRTLTQQMRACG